ncbi:MAG: excinuclease ABC subunit UvrA [Planctomycetales bacterium]|nr:excinuclease ABC subunit UvrA [Planctomycetales bacterium]
MASSDIVIRGAREHNLRNISLALPRNKMIVMTGVSGSGKSSLAFDTLYAEGQRRYVESLSTYARQFLGQMPKPDVDSITGLAPSIAIQQKSTSRNPRSTVGTITEIFDFLRVLYARIGQGYCYVSGKPIKAQSTDQIIDSLLNQPVGTKYQILAPIVQNQKGEFRDLFEDLLKRGYLRARIDGETVSISEAPTLRKHHKHNIEVVIDRLVASTSQRTRVAEAVEQALKLADGRLICSVDDAGNGERQRSRSAAMAAPDRRVGRGVKRRQPTAEPDMVAESPSDMEEEAAGQPDLSAAIPTLRPTDRLYSAHYACAESGMSYDPPSPQLFSFNSPLGMCPDCNGLGMRHGFPLHHLIADETKSIQKGATLLLPTWTKIGRWPRHLLVGAANAIEQDCGLPVDSLLKMKWMEIPAAAKQLWLYGTGERHITFTWKTRGGAWKHGGKWEGWANRLLESYRVAKNPMRRRQLEKYMEVATCPSCHGERLNRQARNVRLRTTSKRFAARGLSPELSLPQVCALSIEAASEYFDSLKLDATQQLIAEEALKEIRGRLGFLLQCGLNYLSLDRSAPTLSGGESQRIRLAGQIGCGLVGVVYILDEPSIGLHPRDNTMLLESLQRLRDQGNTVIVVEHDEETMRAADHIVDFGPGPGVLGGEVVVEGSVEDVLRSERSVTGAFLSGRQKIEIPKVRRNPPRGSIVVHQATHNNLKEVTVHFPLGRLISVTGVSGSGKSSVVNDILWQVVNRDINKGVGDPGKHKRIDGLEQIDKGIDIDQSPIGRTPRSNPATYVKVFDEIRTLFTQLPQSKMRGYKEGRFSFNVADGRCEACEGHGATKLNMDFLADIWIPCNVCEGRRFNHETLEVKFREHSIADILDLDIGEALKLFESFPKIHRMLQTLCDVGLDYMKLGQASPTLSGGEAQRVKLARELGKRSTGRTLYLLDEPTTGLHFADVKKLIEVLQGFVEAGNTVIVIEHNLDVIKTSDWIIDIGPEGGAGDGRVVIEGTPEEVAACDESYTGIALRTVLPGFKRKGGAKKGKTAKRKSDPFIQSPTIRIVGAAQHNLQGIDLEVPREQMSVFCGPSGSGKTSLAMDTLYAEGQRRYVESLSSYARQFLGQMPKPRVESIQGLSPAIAIEQKTVGSTPRSTVGTVTEVYDYLRILFARMGEMYCPECGVPAVQQTTDQIVDSVMKLGAGAKLLLLAPLEVDRSTTFTRVWDRLRANGFARVRVDGKTYPVAEVPEIDHRQAHNVAVVVDRISVDAKQRSRIADSIEAALDLGKGIIHVAVAETTKDEPQWIQHRYSLHLSCRTCQRSFERQTPQKFSFNSPLGWCHACEGLGTEFGANQAMLVTSPERSLLDGAIGAWPDPQTNAPFRMMLDSMSTTFKLPLDLPWYLLSPPQQRLVLYGDDNTWIEVRHASPPLLPRRDLNTADEFSSAERWGYGTFRFKYKGLYPAIEAASRLSFSHRKSLIEMAGERDCTVCHGSRLEAEASALRLRNITLPQLCRMPLSQALAFLLGLKLTKDEKKIAGDLLNEATHRLNFLVEVGLEYLTLDRSMPTLSGGESQRIRLAGQAGRSLTGVLYVLDEPTIGLHPRDNGRLLIALKRLRDLGNTVLLVEHDREVLDAADRLYDFGPGAGRLGGTVVAQGTPAELKQNKASMTGGYLGGTRCIPVPTVRRILGRLGLSPASSKAQHQAKDDPSRGNRPKHTNMGQVGFHDWVELLGAQQHNLRNVDLRIPLKTFTCITGVSGSGKSSLIMDTLARAVARRLNIIAETPGAFRELKGVEHLSKIVLVDQNPIGSTPASNPATYTGMFDEIRELFCRMPEAKVRGYRPGRFSFNRAGGRCEDCEGMGQQKIEMHFLPDVWVECPTCRGRRFNAETLTVKFNDCSIADVLEMSISKALELFSNVPKIRGPLATLEAIGLGYLTLGQSAPTLSGGEAQRIKLAAELCRPNRGRTLYLLDEPTTGLHFDDILKLLSVLNSLVEQGNTVVVIEHNLDVIKTADWVIDLGPEAGAGGGQIVVQGTPEDVVAYATGDGLGSDPHATFALQPSPQANATRAKRKTPKSRAAEVEESVISQRSRDSAVPSQLGLRSWTGELLAAVLAKSARGVIETFDAGAVAAKQKGDVSIEELGRSAKLPWEVDGRKWHTQDRISHTGQPCNWDGQALKYVIELLEKEADLAPTNWNDRATVEIRADKGLGWFLHARSGGEWLLALCFRVKKNAFTTEDLDASLGLKPLDEMEDVQAYGSDPRVKARNLKTAWQEVTIKVWKKSEVDTPAFRQFLKQALKSYLALSKAEAKNPEDLMPWKQLGRKWHLMKQGVPAVGRGVWDIKIVERLLPVVEMHLDKYEVDYGIRSKIHWTEAKSGKAVAELHTKRSDGIDLILYFPSGKVTLGAIAAIGESQEIQPTRDGQDAVRIRFTKVEQLGDTDLIRLIIECRIR